jgi:hypothetical protein
VHNEIIANRKLLNDIDYDEVLGECGLYFTSTGSMNAEDFLKVNGGGATVTNME